MLGKKKKEKVPENLTGVISFFGSFHALRAEKVLKNNGKTVLLIPGPREISPNCGVALRFDYSEKEETEKLLNKSSIQFEAFHLHPAS